MKNIGVEEVFTELAKMVIESRGSKLERPSLSTPGNPDEAKAATQQKSLSQMAGEAQPQEQDGFKMSRAIE